jgi:hypothetical protein
MPAGVMNLTTADVAERNVRTGLPASPSIHIIPDSLLVVIPRSESDEESAVLSGRIPTLLRRIDLEAKKQLASYNI